MLKLVVVAALCFSKAIGEPQGQGDEQMINQPPPVSQYGGPQYGAQLQPQQSYSSPYPYAQSPVMMPYQQPQMMPYQQPQMMPYQPPMQSYSPWGGFGGGYPGSYQPSYAAPSQPLTPQGYSPVSTGLDRPEESVNPDTGVAVEDVEDGGLDWNNNNNNNGGLNWQQPGLNWQQPGMNWQQPGLNWQQPGMNWQQPGMNWQQPGLSWQQPGMNWQQPGLNWQQPGMNWQQPGLNWQQPNNTIPGYQPGPPTWGSSFTPITSGCFNRCKPRCSLSPPRFPPMPPPRPKPIALPPPPPPKPSYGCRSVCRPMCNIQPSCGSGPPSFNGNTMVCGRAPLYQNQYNPGYNYGGYGNQMMNNRPVQMAAQAQPQVQAQSAPAASEVVTEDNNASE